MTHLLPQVFQIIEDKAFENKTASIKIKDLMTVNLTAEYFQIDNITYDRNYTRVDFLENNTIGFHIGQSNFSLYLDYEIDMDPSLVYDKGNLTAGFHNLTYDLVFRMSPRPGDKRYVWVDIVTNNFALTPAELFLHLNSSNDLIASVASVLTTIEPAVVNLVTTTVEDNLQTLVNDAIAKIPIPIVLNDTSIDISLIDTPTVTENFTYNLFVGKIFPTGKDYPVNNTDVIPKYQDGGRSLQIFISQYTIQSYLYTTFTLGHLDVDITESPAPTFLPFNTDAFAYFIPALKKHYGGGKRTKVRFYCLNEEPTITTQKKKLILTGKFDVDVFVEKAPNQWERAVTINTNEIFNGNIQITKNLILTINIDKITAAIIGYQNSNIGEINLTLLKRELFLLENLFRLSLNLILGRGFDIGSRLPIKIDLGQLDFRIEDGYLTLQSDPNSDSFQALFDSIDLKSMLNLNQNTAKKAIKTVLESISPKEMFNNQDKTVARTIYKGYKVFDTILNYGNDDYDFDYSHVQN